MPKPPDWLTIPEAVALLQCSRQHVYKLADAGAIGSTRLYGRRVFSGADVRARAANPPATGRPQKKG